MKLLSIQFKNVFSYGNDAMHSVEFDHGKFYQLVGKNGTGKSSFKDAIIFGLYGKLDGVNTKDIPNDKNGNGYISVKYKMNGHTWVNEWKFNPNSLSVYKDGELLDLGGISMTKSYVYDNMDIPYNIFVNIVSINVSDFKSFLSMSVGDVRAIRDKIFGFDIINDMLSDCRADLNETEAKYGSIETKMETMQDMIENMKAKLEAGKIDRKNKLEIDRNDIKESIEAKRLEWIDTKNGLADLKAQRAKMELDIGYLEYMKNKLYARAISKKTESVKSDIDSYSAKLAQLEELYSKFKIYEEYFDNYSTIDNKNRLNREISSLKNDFSDLSDEVNRYSSELNSVRDKIYIYKQWDAYNQYISLLKVREKANSEITIKNEEAKKLESELNALKTKLDEYKFELHRNSDKATALTESIKVHKSGKCPTCMSDLTDGGHIDNLESELVTLKNRIDDINKLIPDIQKEISLKSDILDRDIKADIHRLQVKISTEVIEVQKPEGSEPSDDISATISLLTKTAADLSDKISDGNNRVHRLNDRIKKAESELYSLPSVNEDLLSMEVDADMDAENVNAKLCDLENEINNAKKSLEDNSSNLDILINKAAILNDRIESYGGITDKPDYMPAMHSLDDINRLEADINTKIVSIDNSIKEYTDNMEKIKVSGKYLSAKLESITESYDEYVSSSLSAIDDIVKDRDELFKSTKGIKHDIDIYRSISYMLGDKGIKSYMLQTIIPYMNVETNNLLDRFDLKFEIRFDENFTPQVLRGGRVVNSSSISTGQTKMANFCILIAMSKILKIRYGSLGVLFYDELFSTIDTDRINIILETIKSVCCDEMGESIVIMNHSVLSESYFDYVVKVEIDAGCSSINVEKLN